MQPVWVEVLVRVGGEEYGMLVYRGRRCDDDGMTLFSLEHDPLIVGDDDYCCGKCLSWYIC